MPFIGSRFTSGGALPESTSSDVPDVASIIDELNSSQLIKTARHFARSTALPIRGSSRSQRYRKEMVVEECPKGQNYYACQSTGFRGCCSKNACDPKVVCPESESTSKSETAETPSKSETVEEASNSVTEHPTDAASTVESTASKSETCTVKSSMTTASGQPAAMSLNATAIRATEDVASAPSCPRGNGTTYTDNTKIAYIVHCNSDNSAQSYNNVQVSIGGYGQCFSSCSSAKECAGFTYVGLDDGTCYLKSTMPKDNYVAKSMSNYISCAKVDPLAAAPRPTETASPDSSSRSPNKGAIAGGVVGGIAVIGLILFLIAFLARRRRQNIENKRATITHVFGGAVEPGRGGYDDGTTLPLHNRQGSTSVFAPFGGYQRPPNGSVSRDYAATTTTSPASTRKAPLPDMMPSHPTGDVKASSPAPYFLPATTYQAPARESRESISMLDSTPVPRSTSRSPRFHEHISELADTSSPPPVITPKTPNKRWGSVLYADKDAAALGISQVDMVGRDDRMEEARKRQQQLHMMSWNSYDEGNVTRAQGGGASADVGATIGREKAPPGNRGPGAKEGEVSPDDSESPLDRRFIVSPMGSLDRTRKE